jgi:hypothetical protein
MNCTFLINKISKDHSDALLGIKLIKALNTFLRFSKQAIVLIDLQLAFKQIVTLLTTFVLRLYHGLFMNDDPADILNRKTSSKAKSIFSLNFMKHFKLVFMAIILSPQDVGNPILLLILNSFLYPPTRCFTSSNSISSRDDLR